MNGIDQILAAASDAIGPTVGPLPELDRWGAAGRQLAGLLSARNGFYAFADALLVRPWQHATAPLGLKQWNESACWKGCYQTDLSETFCFAEDLFGGQFAIREESICLFDPETVDFTPMFSSLDEWIDAVLSDPNLRLGRSLAEDWSKARGPIRRGARLLPGVPFVCGGGFVVDNLRPIEEAEGMRFRAQIANQIQDLPDGAEIILKGLRPSSEDTDR